MLLLRRFVTVAVLMFWQGGFLFYTAVVVPLGTEVLDNSPTNQGFITRRVTVAMNQTAAVALALLAWDVAAARDPRRWRRWGRAGLLLAMAGATVVLVVLHPRLDALLDLENRDVLDRAAFYPLHRAYLWVSTLQWAEGVAFLLLTLSAWMSEQS